MCVLHGCDLFPTPEASSDARQRNAHCFSPICTYRAVYEADSEEEEEEEEDQDEASNSDVSNDDGGGGSDEESGPSSTKPKVSARKTAAVPTKKSKGKDISEDEDDDEEDDVAEPSEEEEDDLLVSAGLCQEQLLWHGPIAGLDTKMMRLGRLVHTLGTHGFQPTLSTQDVDSAMEDAEMTIL